MEQPANGAQRAVAHLGLWDTVSIMIGIVIGASIYQTPPDIMNNASTPLVGLSVWALAGVLALVGAFCYAELASTYPRMGGDYVYLSRAYRPIVGFLFGWAELAVVRTANIGMMAFVFGRYSVRLFETNPEHEVLFALGAVAVLSLLNILGVVLGKSTQNVLSLAKVLGLGAIVVAGFFWRSDVDWTETKTVSGPGIGLALIFVMFAYGGWNDAAFVAAEMRDRKHIPQALILGTMLITLIYLAVNAAYISGLGFDGVRTSKAVAADILRKPFESWGDWGGWGEKGMCLLVMVSTLGAINGLVLTGSRVYAALGAEHRIFALLGRWYPGLGTPLWALLTQMCISLIMITGVGTTVGRNWIDSRFVEIGLSALPWEKYFGGFETLLAGTTPIFWTFFLLTGISLFVLRVKDAGIARPFALAVPFFPLLPLIFCGTCLYMLHSSVDYAGLLVLLGVIPVLFGVGLYFLSPAAVAGSNELT